MASCGPQVFSLTHHPNLLGSACLPSPPKPRSGFGDKAGNPKGSHKPSPIQPPPFCEVRPRCALLMLFAAARRRNEPRRVAASRSGWRRTARLKEPQEHGQQFSPNNNQRFSPIRSSKLAPNSIGFGLSPIPPSGKAAGRRGRRFEEPRYSLSAHSSPQFSAPCVPHCGSALAPLHLRHPLGFHLDFTVAK